MAGRTSGELSEQSVSERGTAGVLERERVRERGTELRLQLLTHELLGAMGRVFTVSSEIPEDDAVSLTLSCSTRRITNTTRKGVGRLSIARSSNSRS
jgi:hypothetical protein